MYFGLVITALIFSIRRPKIDYIYEIASQKDTGGWVTPKLHVPLRHVGRLFSFINTAISPFNILPVARFSVSLRKCGSCGDLGKYFEIAFQFLCFDISYERHICRGIHAITEPIASPPNALPLQRQFIPSVESDSVANVTRKQSSIVPISTPKS